MADRDGPPRPFRPRGLAGSALVARNLAPALLALGLGLADPVSASGPTPLPVFTAAELRIIARNESLRTLLAHEPWLVHRVLKDMERQRTSPERRQVAPEPRQAPPDLRQAPQERPVAPESRSVLGDEARGVPKDRFDRKRDPDLRGLERVAPEAAYDLFLLLKKAGKDVKPEPMPR